MYSVIFWLIYCETISLVTIHYLTLILLRRRKICLVKRTPRIYSLNSLPVSSSSVNYSYHAIHHIPELILSYWQLIHFDQLPPLAHSCPFPLALVTTNLFSSLMSLVAVFKTPLIIRSYSTFLFYLAYHNAFKVHQCNKL